MGAADDWTPPALCKALSEKWGSPITLYPGAYHGFDLPNMPVRIRKTGAGRVHHGTNLAARRKAIVEVMSLLEKALATGHVPAADVK
jgi:dienelactone hydrolase